MCSPYVCCWLHSSEFTQWYLWLVGPPIWLMSSQLTFQDSMFTVGPVILQDSMHLSNSLPIAKSHSLIITLAASDITSWPSRTHQHNRLWSWQSNLRFTPSHLRWKRELGWMAIQGLGDMRYVAACDHPIHSGPLRSPHWSAPTNRSHSMDLLCCIECPTEFPSQNAPNSLGYNGRLPRSRGHHVMIASPHATSSAGHLASGPGTWGPTSFLQYISIL